MGTSSIASETLDKLVSFLQTGFGGSEVTPAAVAAGEFQFFWDGANFNLDGERLKRALKAMNDSAFHRCYSGRHDTKRAPSAPFQRVATCSAIDGFRLLQGLHYNCQEASEEHAQLLDTVATAIRQMAVKLVMDTPEYNASREWA